MTTNEANGKADGRRNPGRKGSAGTARRGGKTGSAWRTCGRWSLLAVAGALGVLGLLTVVPSPAWSPWTWAVLAGEFGHWLAPGALAVAATGWAVRGAVGRAAGVLATGAAGLLLVPTWQAARLAPEVRERFAAAFPEQVDGRGPGETENNVVYSISEYWGPAAEPVTVETYDVSAGLPLDFHPPVRADRRPAPCVVVVHGGGWDSGDRTQLPELNHRLARRGYAVAAVSYRLAPQHRWPAQRDDVLAAVAWLKARAASLGIDPGRFVLLGRSAGGQIVQVAAYTARDPAIRGVVAYYAPSDLYFGYVNTHENDMLRSPALMRQLLGGPPETVRAQYESASALNFVSPASPPTLLLHGRNDALSWYRHSVRLAERLAAAGVPHVHVELPWATHAFDYNLRGPGGQIATWAVEQFLAATVGEPVAP